VFEPELAVVVTITHHPRLGQTQQTVTATWIADADRRFKDQLGEVTEVREPLVALPAGWEGLELSAALRPDAMEYHQRIRVIVCGKVFGDTMVIMAIQAPETVASAAPEFLAALIASTGPA
jgi:hypothetical protein